MEKMYCLALAALSLLPAGCLASHTANAGDITGRRYDATFATADDDGFVCQRRIIAFLDGRIKGVAIHMRHRKRHQFRVGQHTRAAANRAPRRGVKGVQAIATKCWHAPCITARRAVQNTQYRQYTRQGAGVCVFRVGKAKGSELCGAKAQETRQAN